MKALYNACQNSACDTSAVSIDNQHIAFNKGSTAPQGAIITLYPDGQFDGQNWGNEFAGTVVGVASKGQDWNLHPWVIHEKEDDVTGTLWEGTQSNFFDVSRYHDGALAGFISARIDAGYQSFGGCAASGGILAAIAGVFDRVAAAFFGAISGACSA